MDISVSIIRKLSPIIFGLGTSLLPLAWTGCGSQPPAAAPTKPPAQAATTTSQTTEEHGHKPGTHGGLIVPIGVDNYHAEAIFSKNGTLKLFLLGKDESRVQETEEQVLTAYARLAGAVESTEITLKSRPQPGDSSGKTSLFEGTLPQGMEGKSIDVTIPSLRMGGERFRLAVQSRVTEENAHPSGMPANLSGEAERELFLKPGGAYTQADIAANGNTVPSVKFKGIRANHDAKPKPGDRVCPISLTKANPAFSWTVAGKVYQFCCPPCIEEFVQQAKDKPDQLKEPSTYIAK